MSYPGMHPGWIKIGAFLKAMPLWWHVYATVVVLAWIVDIASWFYVLSR